MPELTVVIVNHNSGESLVRCLAALRNAESLLEVVVVDNSSGDNSLSAALVPAAASVIQNPENRGFGPACNQGARKGSAKHLVFLNPDCVATPDALVYLARRLDSNPQIAAIGPRILRPDDQVELSWWRDLTFANELERRRLWRSWERGEQKAVAKIDRLTGAPRTVDWISGACLAVPRGRFERVGGFDEDFFLYLEDADLCRRLRNEGGTVQFDPTVAIIHRGGASASPPKTVREHYDRSHRLYYRKHCSLLDRWLLALRLALS